MVRAAIVGAIMAVLGFFLFFFVSGALFGEHPPFDEHVAYGWQGGVNAVDGVLFVSILAWPLLFGVAALGAGAGVLFRALVRARSR
jgi:hypothetical protein